ncbi:Hypothetical predicted protein [Pelobates cultripes]|uniref:Uncharacterized protein n=1 Tax=Pelobates cultripes TaxID=61616 RepID=A0AAD1WPJ9_PELCU|nr:Hypothetical predicted protein [Pelobates cultripes]
MPFVYPARVNRRKCRPEAYKPTAALDWSTLLGRFEPPEDPEEEDLPTEYLPTLATMRPQSQKPPPESPSGSRCHAATTITAAQNGTLNHQGTNRPHTT